MKTTVSLYNFREAFRTMGRAEQFSYEGLEVLFDYLEQYEEDTGEELELDVIALCCDFYEDTVEAIAANYSIDLTDCEGEEEQAELVREYLEDNGAFVGAVTGGFVYRAF
jgi:predicted ArsR family transcriptional regulator